ncbi:hypothetical protein SISNIDRAFT_552609 [Sistotremastrum niveocremeum HHB9708]|uniref:DUF6533 domain-containing protein n=1 Tax=Sistotremastrum niveocremeum HHB9708 TaxID=1314777 RepID=A0A164P4G2_9AGAM|nr:hypothetical protein SISNIDRAFT_552609 [Sistotremastrum niveocremeum HHB9708]
MSSDGGQAEFEILIKTLRQYQVVNYICIAAAVWMGTDTIFNLSDEIELIWKSPWSLPKILYLIARYLGVFDTIFTAYADVNTTAGIKVCTFWKWYIQLGGPLLFFIVTNIIFIMRLHALYNKSKKLLVFLVAGFLVNLGFGLYSTMGATLPEHVIPRPIPEFPGCAYLTVNDDVTFFGWIPSAVFALVFFCLTVAKLLRVLKEHTPANTPNVMTLENVRANLGPLYMAFMRDGAFFFALLFATELSCALIWANFKGTAIALTVIPLYVSVYSYVASHLLLNLRHAAKQREYLSDLPDGQGEDLKGGKAVRRQSFGLSTSYHEMQFAERSGEEEPQ